MENKLARIMKATGPMRFFLPIGIILIVFGIIMMSMTPKSYAMTEGTVTGAKPYSDTDSDGHPQDYFEAEFSYTVDGKEYHNSFSGYTEEPKIGEKLDVYYDPANPEFVSNTKSTGTIAIVMIGLGALAVVASILFTVKAFRKYKAMDEQIKAAVGSDKIPVVTPLPKEQLTEYYVSYDGRTMTPGYIVEDRARNQVYTATMTKQIPSRQFTFTDLRLGRSAEHKVGHVVTQQFDNEVFSTSSWFKFDGENIWDLLHEKGVRIETDLVSIFPRKRYTVTRNGRFYATVESSSKYVHEEDEAQHKLKIPYDKFYYRFWTNEADLELLFLTVFAISETEAAVVE